MADITGDSGPNTLTGTSGNDNIFGLEGNDTLDGAGGIDVLNGGLGDDTIFVDADDSVVEAANEGYDYVVARTSYVLAAGVSVELISTDNHAGTAAINLGGNAFGQILVGNAGNNYLDGGGGADVLVGFGGNDVLIVDADDRVLEEIGDGFDTVAAKTSYLLEAGQEIEVLSTTNNAGTAVINLTGNAFGQVVIGNAGNNYIDGGGGLDLLVGGAGNDVLIVDADDRVVEAIGGGFDTVAAKTSHVLEAGQEIEVLSTTDNGGTAAINLGGNAFGQVVIGNAGNNYLDGGGGADLLVGLGGDDVLVVDADDRVVEAVGGGYDTVAAKASYLLEAGQEVEVLSTTNNAGTAAINLGGNEFGQTVIGNAGNNYIDGGAGADVLVGLGGDDIYIVDADDRVIEGASAGSDSVAAKVSYVLEAGQAIETLSTTDNGGIAAISLTGNEFSQVLIGNAGANILDGKGGNDLMVGLGGADTFAFTTALGVGNIDTINDFVAGTDKIQLGGAAGQPFLALATGALRAGTLVIGTAALDADDYLIYNSGTGALLFDADGNGAGAAVQFATLSTGLALNVGDFLVSGAANNAPVITSGATAQVAENSAASTIVYQVAATDADGDRISYALTGADAALLTIDAGGAVRLIAPANFEAKATYNFNVVASDSGVSTSKAVTLTITDVAEGGPGTPTINETAAINDSTAAAQAIDRGTLAVAANPNLFNDALPSATIIGSVSTDTDTDYFSITLQAGELIVLDIDGTTNSLDAFLTLYNSNGAAIGENDDLVSFDPGSSPPFGHNTDSQIRFRVGTSGTYYFSVSSFEGTSNGNYQLHVSIGPPANAQQIQAEDIDALISGAAWPTTNITYSFPDSAGDYPPGFGDPEEPEPPSFAPFSPGQQAAVQQLLAHIANVSVLTFQQLTGASDGDAKLRYAMTSATDAAHAYYPGGSDEAGSAWFNKTDFNSPIKGNYAWMGMLHETGHALGLKHGHEFPAAVSADKDSVEYTVMTYRSYPGDNTTGGYANETFGYPQTLMMYDIAALQKIYDGANYGFNNSNSVYTWSSSTGEMSINGAGQGAPGANRIFMTIWDGGGTDTYDLSAYSTPTTIDLRPGEWTTTSAVQLANLGQGHVARGNVANALMFEGNIDSLIENAIGGSGQDTLIANQVANRFTGNAGIDLFKWAASGDAGIGALADTITDFVRGTDKVDLSAIDANPATGGVDDFVFIGTAAFHNVAGELRYEVTGGNAHIFADLDGNGTADMQIIVNNVTVLAGSDFNF